MAKLKSVFGVKPLIRTSGEDRPMRSDAQIQQDVETELRWCSGIDATDIVVGVREGVVTLSGCARNYSEKSEAEATAKRIAGVTAVAEDIQVRL